MKTKLERFFDQLLKRYSPMYVIFLGAILIVIGTGVAAIGTLLQNYNNAKKAKTQNDQIESLTLQNAELSKQLTNEALEINKNITGGDNYLSFSLVLNGEGKYVLTATNDFDHNIPNSKLRVINYSAIEKCPKTKLLNKLALDEECVKKNTLTIPQQGYNAKGIFHLDQVSLRGQKLDGKLIFFFTTPRNEFFYEFIYSIQSSADFKYGYRLSRRINGKYVPIFSTDPKKSLAEVASFWDNEFQLGPEFGLSN